MGLNSVFCATWTQLSLWAQFVQHHGPFLIGLSGTHSHRSLLCESVFLCLSFVKMEQRLPFSDSESFSSSIMQTITTDWRKMGHASLILLLLINSLVPFSSGKYKCHFLIWVFQSPIRFAVCSLIIVDFVDYSEPLFLNYAHNIFIHTSPALDENERHHEFLFVVSI